MRYNQSKPRLLFLYTEIADYFVVCIKKLLELYDVEVFVIHWPINKEAPFAFQFPEGSNFYDKSQFTFRELENKVSEISPDFIFCSGWMDKDYLRIAKKSRKKIPVAIGIDNQWEHTFRQYIACVLSRLILLKIFTHCWVPGERQKKYAQKLGFREDKILTGFYSADVDYFLSIGDGFSEEKKLNYPHKIIYVGRYYSFKGIDDLWNAFIQWQNESNNDWELWCLGTGDLPPAIHPKIKHFGFVQPKDFAPYVGKTGVYVMPSSGYEHWGVAMHEFAAASFPIICSDIAGAGDAFVKDGVNGYVYKAGDIEAMKKCFVKMASVDDEMLYDMGKISRELARAITPAKWAETLMSIINIDKIKQEK